MTWHRLGDKPLSEPMMVSLPTHICVTQQDFGAEPILEPLELMMSKIIVVIWINTKQWDYIGGINQDGLPASTSFLCDERIYVKNISIVWVSSSSKSNAKVLCYVSIAIICTMLYKCLQQVSRSSCSTLTLSPFAICANDRDLSSAADTQVPWNI